MKCFFIGGTKRGFLTLKALLEHGSEVAGIVNLRQDEHETERFEDAIRQLASDYGIAHFETKWLKDRNYAEAIRASGADLAVVVGCRVLIHREIYETPRLGTVAVHDSLLPKYRGFAPLNWAMINGERCTGVTLFYLSESMDEGDIVGSKPVPIQPSDTAPQVYTKICEATVELVLEHYAELAAGSAPRMKQDNISATYTCSRTPTDGVLDWSWSTKTLLDKIRALTAPYPGAYTHYRGKRLTIWSASYPDQSRQYVGRISGRIISVSKQRGHVDVLTGDGILRIEEVQLKDEARTCAANVATSIRDTLGLRAEDLLERISVLEDELAVLRATSERNRGPLGPMAEKH